MSDRYVASDIEIDFHDKFLSEMVNYEFERKEDEERKPIDLSKFVDLLDTNRRWTYQGSLTTHPVSEGILWNVVEQVIPIRQSTLDKFNTYRKVEDNMVANKVD